jgi:hypothetical protein
LFEGCFVDHGHPDARDDENEYQSSAGVRPPMRTTFDAAEIGRFVRSRLSAEDAEQALCIMKASGLDVDLPKPATEGGFGGRFAEPLDGAVTLIKRSEAPTGRQGMDALDALLQPRRSSSAIEHEAARMFPGIERIGT